MSTYILQKDLPNAVAGVHFEWSIEYDMYKSIGCDYYGKYTYYAKEVVEDNIEWFKEASPIVIISELSSSDGNGKDYWYKFKSNVSLVGISNSAIIKAIEFIANQPQNFLKNQIKDYV